MFSLQMQRIPTMQRILSATPQDGVPLDRLRKVEPMVDSDWQRLVQAHVAISEAGGVWIDDTPQHTTATIRTALGRHARRHGMPGLVLIDCLGLLDRTSPALEIADHMRDLKILARDLALPMLVVHQLAELWDSDDVDRHAHVVLGVHCPAVDSADDTTDVSELWVLKHAHGATGTARVKWQPQFARFANLT